jgi:hypothetical protein
MVFFSNPKLPIWVILEGLAMKDVGIFFRHLIYFTAIGTLYAHLVYFLSIWYILRPFGTLYGHLVYVLWSFGT